MGVGMRMGNIVVAGVTHRSVSGERIAGGLNGRDDGTTAQDLGELIGLDAKVEGLAFGRVRKRRVGAANWVA